MIADFVKAWDARKGDIEAQFAAAHPENYKAVIAAVIRIIAGDDVYDAPSVDRIHEIDDGEYQGTLVYVIGAGGYQPHEYWYVKVGYGSCSGCDTLEAIRNYDDGAPSAEQVKDYMTLALHVVQGLHKMGGSDA